jgi:hypothetical protein
MLIGLNGDPYCYEHITYRKNVYTSGVMKDIIWIGHSIIGGYKTSPSYLSRRPDRTTMSGTFLYGLVL